MDLESMMIISEFHLSKLYTLHPKQMHRTPQIMPIPNYHPRILKTTTPQEDPTCRPRQQHPVLQRR
jgi:hypothetical protein